MKILENIKVNKPIFYNSKFYYRSIIDGEIREIHIKYIPFCFFLDIKDIINYENKLDKYILLI